MRRDVSSSISLVALILQDFLGAILPGMVWSVEFLTLKEITVAFFITSSDTERKLAKSVLYPSTFDVAISLVQNQTFAYYAGFVVCSLIIGFICNALPSQWSERACLTLLYILDFRKLGGHKKYKEIESEHSFPFDNSFLSQNSAFTEVKALMERKYGKDVCSGPSDYHRSCFNMCKKLIRYFANDYIKDRVEYLETQNRMLSSLLLASIANIALVVFALYMSSNGNFYSLIPWCISSCLISVVLLVTYDYRRHTEVSAVYTYVLFLLKDKSIF